MLKRQVPSWLLGEWVSDKIDIAFTLSINEYMGYKSIQFMLLDFKKSIN